MTRKRQGLMLGSCVLIVMAALFQSATFAAGKPTRRMMVDSGENRPRRPARERGSIRNGSARRSRAGVVGHASDRGWRERRSGGQRAAREASSLREARHARAAAVGSTLRFDRLRVGATTYDIRAGAGSPPGSRDNAGSASNCLRRQSIRSSRSIASADFWGSPGTVATARSFSIAETAIVHAMLTRMATLATLLALIAASPGLDARNRRSGACDRRRHRHRRDTAARRSPTRW